MRGLKRKERRKRKKREERIKEEIRESRVLIEECLFSVVLWNGRNTQTVSCLRCTEARMRECH